MTEPTLDYLRALQASGATLTDFEAAKINENAYRVTVHCADGSSHGFGIESESTRFMAHFREAVVFTGFGGRGLSNLIHADVMEQVRESSLPQESFTVVLSQACFERVQKHVKQWTHYGYRLLVSKEVSGFGYTIRTEQP